VGPVRVKKTRQNKNLEPRSDSIGTEKAQGPNEMPLELLPAAVREEVSIAYEFASPGTFSF
jgi:hypothetical protein